MKKFIQRRKENIDSNNNSEKAEQLKEIKNSNFKLDQSREKTAEAKAGENLITKETAASGAVIISKLVCFEILMFRDF